MEILRVENLRKEYGRGEARVNALDGISFSVEKGQENQHFFIFSEALTDRQPEKYL